GVTAWLLALVFLRSLLSFFFQAEDGIRDRNVTGVQTCALPIYHRPQLLVAAERARLEQPDVESAFSVAPLADEHVGHHLAGRPRTHEAVAQQQFAVPVGPLHQFGLHIVVRYQRYRLFPFHTFIRFFTVQ